MAPKKMKWITTERFTTANLTKLVAPVAPTMPNVILLEQINIASNTYWLTID